jgi:hypothetical protein
MAAMTKTGSKLVSALIFQTHSFGMPKGKFSPKAKTTATAQTNPIHVGAENRTAKFPSPIQSCCKFPLAGG